MSSTRIDLRNDHCYDEERVAKRWVGMLCEAVSLVFANHEVELVESRVYQ